MDNNRQIKAQQFLDLHQRDHCFVMPNAWDAGSAKMLASAGFDALGTTSAGIAFSMGKPDNVFCLEHARVDRNKMIEAVQTIAASVSLPVNADLESGYGENVEDVAETINLAIAAGAVGGNIEDYTGDSEAPLYDIELAVERIVAARAAINVSGIPFVLVARTDRLNIGRAGGLAEVIERLNLYLDAGADCVFAPGLADLQSIETVVKELTGPLNVVMGLIKSEMTVPMLRDVGVRRISIGGSLVRALYFQMRVAAKELFEQGSFNFAKSQIPQAELNNLFEKAC